jgi:hypothetical protein
MRSQCADVRRPFPFSMLAPTAQHAPSPLNDATAIIRLGEVARHPCHTAAPFKSGLMTTIVPDTYLYMSRGLTTR